MVEKLLLEKNNDGEAKAQAVQYVKDGQIETVAANKDIVLCAGAFQTPQLLELSGIGNQTFYPSTKLKLSSKTALLVRIYKTIP